MMLFGSLVGAAKVVPYMVGGEGRLLCSRMSQYAGSAGDDDMHIYK